MRPIFTLVLPLRRSFTRRLLALGLALLAEPAPVTAQGSQTTAHPHPAAAGTAASTVATGAPDTVGGRITARPGWLVFKVKDELKNRLTISHIEDPALTQALAAVGATDLRQTFPRAVAPPREPVPGQAPGVDLTLVYQCRYAAGRLTLAQAQRRLLATGTLEYAEPVRDYPLLLEPNDPLADSVTGTQYHLKNIRAYQGWDLEQGDSTEVIGVIDTGTRFSHRDMQGAVALNYADPINGLDDDGDGYIDNFRGWDVADDDNQPTLDAITTSQPTHGGLVAGTLTARPNNGLGGAGVAFNCRHLPVKIYASTPGGRAFAGYEGIVYAADHGCRVINCSWGGPGAFSQFEQDVITYATVNRNAVVVAAAGNTNADLDFYPSSYQGVLAVASLDRFDVKGASNTYSYRISLAAPGRQIITTSAVDDSTYVSASGSSFAAPMVAGTAALVRHRFPALTAAQVAERVRITADTSIYALSGNANFQERLGRGRVNMRRALADTAVRSVRVVATRFARSLAGANFSGGPFYPGDTVTIEADFRNYLAPLQGLAVTLTSPSAHVQVLATTYAAGPLGTLATATAGGITAFRLLILPTAPLNAVVPLRFGFGDGSGYRDYQYVKLEVNPDYVTLTANRLAVTVTSRGNLGFDNGNPTRGRGVRFDRSDQLLAEGGLLVGRDAARVSDMVRSATAGQPDQDFRRLAPIRFQAIPTMPFADQEAAGAFRDSTLAPHARVEVRQRAWASAAPGHDTFVFLAYDVINRDTAALTTGYAGLFADWDLHSAEHNRTAWDGPRRLAYAHALAPADSIFTGIKLLTTGGSARFYALDQLNASAPGPVNATNGLTAAEKYAALQAAPGAPQTAGTGAFGTDVAQVVAQALPTLASGDTARVAFALVAAPSLAALQAAADSAQALYDLQVTPAPNAPVATGGARCGTGSLTLTAAGAPAGATYRWYLTATGGLPISGQTGAVFTTPALTVSTTYYVSAVGRNGRESARMAVVATVNARPVAQLAAGGPTVFCAGDSVVLTGSGGGSYQFLRNGLALNGATDSTLTVRTAGDYTLVARSAAGCADTAAGVLIVVNPVPSAAFAYAASSYCLGSSPPPAPTLTGAGGGVFSASPAGLTLDPATGLLDLSASTAGAYTVSYAVAGPCPAAQSQTLTLLAAPTPAIAGSGPLAFCPGDSVVLTASGGGAYLWNTGQTTPTLTVRAGGTYSVTATSAAGCPATSAAVTVTLNPVPVPPVLTQTAQVGGVLLTATGGGATTQFYLNGVLLPGAVGATYLATQPGTYTATTTNTAGCVSAPSAPTTVVVTGRPGSVAAAAGFDLFPNPASAAGPATLVLHTTTNGSTVTVFDHLGRRLVTLPLPASGQLAMPALPAGVYAVQVRTPHGAAVKRLVSE